MSKRKSSSPPSGQKWQKNGHRSYTPISDALSQPNTLADNVFSTGIVRFSLLPLLNQCMKKERRSDGVELVQILMTLLGWPALNSPLAIFACTFIAVFWLSEDLLDHVAVNVG